MAKRRRMGDSLTGGSGDVNPQTMQFVLNPALTGGVQEWDIVTPYSRLPRSGNKVTIMEILKIRYEMPDCIPAPGGATFTGYLHLWVATRSVISHAGSIGQPGSIDNYRLAVDVPTAVLFGGPVLQEKTVTHDLTDGAGHGILVATDSIILGGGGHASLWIAGTGAAISILYRFKHVTLEEYIGIVQSQQ